MIGKNVKLTIFFGFFLLLSTGFLLSPSKTQAFIDCEATRLGCIAGGDNYCRTNCGPGWVCYEGVTTATMTKDNCYSAFGQPHFESNKLAGYELTGIGLNSLISNVILAAGAIVGLIFFALLVMGGISYMTAGGDDKALLKAKNQIMHALVGLMIVFFAYWVVRIIGAVFGINLLSPTFKGP